MIGKYCVVRTYSAGVHIGTVQSLDETRVTLLDARRIWRWRGANTLSEVSQTGVVTSEFTRISEQVPSIYLSEAVEVIPCSDQAKVILDQSVWN